MTHHHEIPSNSPLESDRSTREPLVALDVYRLAMQETFAPKHLAENALRAAALHDAAANSKAPAVAEESYGKHAVPCSRTAHDASAPRREQTRSTAQIRSHKPLRANRKRAPFIAAAVACIALLFATAGIAYSVGMSHTNDPAVEPYSFDLSADGAELAPGSAGFFNPLTGMFEDTTAYIGCKFRLGPMLVGADIDTITLTVEGQDAWLETYSRTDKFTYSKSRTYVYGSLLSEKSQRKDGKPYDERTENVILYFGVPTSEVDIPSSGSDAEQATASAFACAKRLAEFTLTVDVTYTNGTTQTKTYVIEPASDFEERVESYYEFHLQYLKDAAAASIEEREKMTEEYSSYPPEGLYTVREIS